MSVICAERYPETPGVLCTRDRGHNGGHVDSITNVYWQAVSRPVADPIADMIVRDRRAADWLAEQLEASRRAAEQAAVDKAAGPHRLARAAAEYWGTP